MEAGRNGKKVRIIILKVKSDKPNMSNRRERRFEKIEEVSPSRELKMQSFEEMKATRREK
jgi:hypothetical protein